jgi:hypothetical protein
VAQKTFVVTMCSLVFNFCFGTLESRTGGSQRDDYYTYCRFSGQEESHSKDPGCDIDGFSLYSVISLFPCVFLGTMI